MLWYFIALCLAFVLSEGSYSPYFSRVKGPTFATWIIEINHPANHCICLPSICVSQYTDGKKDEKNQRSY